VQIINSSDGGYATPKILESQIIVFGKIDKNSIIEQNNTHMNDAATLNFSFLMLIKI
jgi:hypothetical protein